MTHNDFYTNVAVHGNKILVNGYRDGKRYKQEVRYKPYLFIPKKGGDSGFKTLDGKTVERFDFDSIKDARNFVDQYSEVSNFEIFGLNKFQYAFLNDEYPGEVKFDPGMIRVHNIDIETGKTADGSFADVDLANGPITLIGIGIKKQRIIFGYKENYVPKSEDVVYILCKNEKDMLQKFINFWTNDDFRPDVVTGWNIERYDVPFIVNRIRLILGDREARKLSPWGILKEREIEIKGTIHTIFIPVGVAILDYYDLYKKFTQNELESYTLDNVAFVEVGKRKLDYSEYNSLQDLYEQNFEKFVDYNIVDIDRVADIDDKNKFLELVYTIAYDAKVNFIDGLTSVLLWDIIIHNYLYAQKIVIPHKTENDTWDFAGAYVKDPKPGLYEWIMSCDVQSLYPHLIIQYNISPETIHTATFTPNDIWKEPDIVKALEGNIESKEKNLIQCGNGAQFIKSKHGFLPQLMKLQFKQRSEYKRKMIDLEKNDPDSPEIRKYYNFQWAKKIQLNSAYGALANKYFRWYDWRLASAITMSGQLAIRWIEKSINTYMNKQLSTKDVDYVIAMDTDSCYIDMKLMVAKLDTSGTPVDFLHNFAQNCLQPIIKQGFKELATATNAYENVLVMVRDVICDKAIWTAKKRYIMSVWDKEGVRYKEPSIKFVGVEAVRSVIPQVCRDNIKKAIKLIFKGTNQDVKDFIKEFEIKYRQMTFDEIAFPRGVNGLDKYNDAVTLYKKGTPIHTKASLIYNDMVVKRGLKNKYSLIYNRDKIKFIYLKPNNPSGSPVIAAPRHIPEEFKLDKFIDYELMFEKTFLGPLSLVLDAIGWSYKEQSTLDKFF